MNNPILVEVTRGSRVESWHRGSVAVVDAEGGIVHSLGDISAPVFPRSAIKVMQALPLVESGAADRYAFGDRELAFACASHSGEEGHVALAADILRRAGLDERALECGCHWPSDSGAARALARQGRTPGALHNNCSGKHSGFLCTAVAMGEPTAGYIDAEHPVQARAKAAMEDLTGVTFGDDVSGIDGCSIPTYAAPLQSFAQGFAKLVSGIGVSPERAAAGQRLIAACIAEPWYMAGTGRACVSLIEAGAGRVFVKTGAEGVFCGAVPELGLGFALKIDDGAGRAAEISTAATLAHIFRDRDPDLAARYDGLAQKTLKNWKGIAVGELRAAKG